MIYTAKITKTPNRNIQLLPISGMNNYIIQKDNNVDALCLLDEKIIFDKIDSLKSNVDALPFFETNFNENIKKKFNENIIENLNIDVDASLNKLFNTNNEELFHDNGKEFKLRITDIYKNLIKYDKQNGFIKFTGTTHSIYSSDFLYIQFSEILKKYFNYNLEKNNLLINRINEKIDYEISNVLINNDELNFFVSELCKTKNTKINNIMGIYYFKNHKDLKKTLYENYHNIYDVIQFGHQYSYTKMQLKNEILSEVKSCVYEYSFCEKTSITYFEEKLSKDENLFELVFEQTTVKPYFDLEMEIQLSHEEQMEKLNIFINYLIKEIKIIYDIDITKDDFVILDSNSNNKLSFHLVINNHIYFENKDEHLRFIIYLKNRFENPLDDEEKEIVKNLEWIKVDKTGKELKRFIFDDSVYTTNRLFRCINQSKVGKNNPLKLISNHSILDTLITYDVNQNRKISLKTCKLNKNFEEDLSNNKKGVKTRKVIKLKNKKELAQGLEKDDSENEDSENEDENENKKKKILTEVKKDENGNIIKVIYNKIEYDTIGQTLQEKENKSDDEILKIEEEYLRYLYVIPIQETFAQWINIGMALKRCKANYEIWDEWSKLGDKYLEGDCEKRYEKFETEKGYGLNLLKQIAMKIKPELFDNFNKIYDLLYRLKLNEIEQITDTSRYLNSEYLKTEKKHLIIHAKMGAGKTQGTKQIIKEGKYKSCLFLSSRQTFANFVKGEFKNFDNYIDICSENIENSNYLIISMESLQKINVNKKYELIVCDEIETLLSNLSGDTMGNKTYKNFNILKNLILNSKKVLYMDAFISNRTVEFVKNLSNNNENIKYIKNTEIYEPIKAQQISYKSDKTIDFIYNMILNGKKLYISFASNRKLKDFVSYLKRKKDENTVLNEDFINKILIYNSDTTKTESSDSLENINISWKKASLVIASPKITVGCSFNPEGDKENPIFDAIINLSIHSCTARDMMQNLRRVRNVKEDGLYFGINNSAFNNFEKNYESLRKFNEYEDNKKDCVLDFLNKSKEERQKNNGTNGIYDSCDDLNYLINYLETNQTDKLLRNIFFYNSLEKNLSHRYYKKYYLKLLPFAGFKIKDENDNNNNTNNNNNNNNNDIINPNQNPNINNNQIEVNPFLQIFNNMNEQTERYDKIKNIDDEEYEKLDIKQKAGLTKKDENESIEKYFFTKIYNKKMTTNDKMASLFYDIYKDTFYRKKLLNDYYYNKSEEDILKNELNKKLCTEKLDNLHVKNKIIKEIEKIIGIEHGNFNQDITVEQIENSFDYLQTNRKYIHDVFKLRDYKINIQIEDNRKLQYLVQTLNKFFYDYNGYNLKRNLETQNYRFSHKLKESYEYRCLTSVTSYEDYEIMKHNQPKLLEKEKEQKNKIDKYLQKPEEVQNKKQYKIKIEFENTDINNQKNKEIRNSYYDTKEKCEEQYEKLLLELHLPDIKVKDEVKIGEKEILNIEMFENNQKTKESLKPDFRIKIKYEKNNIKKLKNKYEYENLYFGTKEECDTKYEELFNQLNIIIEKKKLLINKEILEQDKRLEKERLEREKKWKKNKMNMIQIEVYLLNQLQKSQIYQENVIYV